MLYFSHTLSIFAVLNVCKFCSAVGALTWKNVPQPPPGRPGDVLPIQPEVTLLRKRLGLGVDDTTVLKLVHMADLPPHHTYYTFEIKRPDNITYYLYARFDLLNNGQGYVIGYVPTERHLLDYLDDTTEQIIQPSANKEDQNAMDEYPTGLVWASPSGTEQSSASSNSKSPRPQDKLLGFSKELYAMEKANELRNVWIPATEVTPVVLSVGSQVASELHLENFTSELMSAFQVKGKLDEEGLFRIFYAVFELQPKGVRRSPFTIDRGIFTFARFEIRTDKAGYKLKPDTFAFQNFPTQTSAEDAAMLHSKVVHEWIRFTDQAQTSLQKKTRELLPIDWKLGLTKTGDEIIKLSAARIDALPAGLYIVAEITSKDFETPYFVFAEFDFDATLSSYVLTYKPSAAEVQVTNALDLKDFLADGTSPNEKSHDNRGFTKLVAAENVGNYRSYAKPLQNKKSLLQANFPANLLNARANVEVAAKATFLKDHSNGLFGSKFSESRYDFFVTSWRFVQVDSDYHTVAVFKVKKESKVVGGGVKYFFMYGDFSFKNQECNTQVLHPTKAEIKSRNDDSSMQELKLKRLISSNRVQKKFSTHVAHNKGYVVQLTAELEAEQYLLRNYKESLFFSNTTKADDASSSSTKETTSEATKA